VKLIKNLLFEFFHERAVEFVAEIFYCAVVGVEDHRSFVIGKLAFRFRVSVRKQKKFERLSRWDSGGFREGEKPPRGEEEVQTFVPVRFGAKHLIPWTSEGGEQGWVKAPQHFEILPLDAFPLVSALLKWYFTTVGRPWKNFYDPHPNKKNKERAQAR